MTEFYLDKILHNVRLICWLQITQSIMTVGAALFLMTALLKFN